MTGRKHKKVCIILNHIEYFIDLASTITGYISFSAFTFLFGISIGITSSAIGLKICAITTGIVSQGLKVNDWEVKDYHSRIISQGL